MGIKGFNVDGIKWELTNKTKGERSLDAVVGGHNVAIKEHTHDPGMGWRHVRVSWTVYFNGVNFWSGITKASDAAKAVSIAYKTHGLHPLTELR